MKKTTLRFFTSTALGVSLVAASSVALAQQPPAPAPPPPAAGAPAPMAEPAPAEPPVEAAPVPVVETPPAPPPEPKKSDASPIAVSYDKGVKFTSEDGNFELKLSLRSQLRWELDKGTEDGAEYKDFFTIVRGRFIMDGFVFGKDTIYKLEFALADKIGFASTKDLYIEQRFSEGKLGLRLGQFKTPFNRQEIVSDFASEFNEHALTGDWVRGGRDIGLLLNNGYADKAPDGVEWAVGVFNSFASGKDKVVVSCPLDASGQPKCGSPAGGVSDWDPAIFARVGYASPKFKGYSEADLEGGPLRYGVAVSYKLGLGQFRHNNQDSKLDGMDQAVGLDGALKVEGFDAAFGVFLMGVHGTKTGLGAHVQAGYFVLPKKAQLAVRYAFIPNPVDADKTDTEIRGAFNWYFHGHQWKIATDFGALLPGVGGGTIGGLSVKTDDPQIQIRTMAQLTF